METLNTYIKYQKIRGNLNLVTSNLTIQILVNYYKKHKIMKKFINEFCLHFRIKKISEKQRKFNLS